MLCKVVHDKSHNIINYDNKNYICSDHNGYFIKYCLDCKDNMFIQCEKNHKNHRTIYLGEFLHDKDAYLNKIINLKKKIEKMNKSIKEIIKTLNNAIDNVNIYYKLCEDIINKYDIKTINYQLLKNIDEFNNFNDILMKNIDDILSEDILENKFHKIIHIFNYEQNALNKKFDCYSTVNLNSPVSSILLLKNKNDIAICLTNGDF